MMDTATENLVRYVSTTAINIVNNKTEEITNYFNMSKLLIAMNSGL